MSKSTKTGREGTVLLVVLVLVLLMSVAAYSYLLSMQTENIAARRSGDRLAARHAALSGIELLSALLELPRNDRAKPGGLDSDSPLLAGEMLQEESGSEDRLSFTVSLPESKGLDRGPLRAGTLDESAKLHLVKLVEWDQEQEGAGRTALLRLPGMTPDVADAILDWVDADDQPRSDGAESDAYAALTVPWRPRNGHPLDLEELLLVRGVERPWLLYGPPAAPAAGPAVALGDDPPQPWSHYLTVYSAERNESGDGQPRIYLNDPQLDSLHRQLIQRLPVAWANFIILYRQHGPGASSESALTTEQIKLDFSSPASHVMESPLDLIDVSVSVPHDGDVASVVSPFTSDPGLMQSQLPQLLDHVTVSAATRLEGRVNVNRAPREVLLAVPGIGEDLAERILAARSMFGEDSLEQNHPVWLVTRGLIDVAEARELLPRLNTGGDVRHAEFWGLLDQAAVYRCEAIVDASGETARQIYFRELFPAKHQQEDEENVSTRKTIRQRNQLVR